MNECTWWLTLSFECFFQIFVELFKFFCIIALNTALACSLYRSINSADVELGGANSSKAVATVGRGSRARVYVKSNVILFADTLLYVTTNWPNTVDIILKYANRYYGYEYSASTQAFMGPFVVTASNFNNAMNFYLYFAVSRRFREGFRVMCRNWCGRRQSQSQQKTIQIQNPTVLGSVKWDYNSSTAREKEPTLIEWQRIDENRFWQYHFVV